ncbi:hypothetical protein PIROE2DRAFT_19748 [Piromyces sp. E2]|nr:hypothetical protein PIROE2DRAFT_19748 [Piromyces sp. E2]|eukprot:OUM69160.1 hypothetical protein PIROE2DRAFT_19748 [Piromyces sp. E2]
MAFDRAYLLIAVSAFTLIIMLKEINSKWDILPDDIPYKYEAEGKNVGIIKKKYLPWVPAAGIVLIFSALMTSKHPGFCELFVKVTPKNYEVTYRNVRVLLLTLATISCGFIRSFISATINSKPISKQNAMTTILLLIAFVVISVPSIKKAAQDADNAPDNDNKDKEVKQEKEVKGKEVKGKVNNKKKRN